MIKQLALLSLVGMSAGARNLAEVSQGCVDENVLLADTMYDLMQKSYDKFDITYSQCETDGTDCVQDGSTWTVYEKIKGACEKAGGQFITYHYVEDCTEESGYIDATYTNLPDCVGLTCSEADYARILQDEEDKIISYYGNDYDKCTFDYLDEAPTDPENVGAVGAKVSTSAALAGLLVSLFYL
jgi:hypothetical protein